MNEFVHLTKEYFTQEQIVNFWEKVEKGKSCWNWLGSLDKDGYGRSSFVLGSKRKGLRAHRVSYTLLRGTIPKGLVTDHLCRNRKCVNPDHLEMVTIKENVLRGTGITAALKRATHCKNGHEYSEENTYHIPKGGRDCRTCRKTTGQLFRAKNRRSGPTPSELETV